MYKSGKKYKWTVCIQFQHGWYLCCSTIISIINLFPITHVHQKWSWAILWITIQCTTEWNLKQIYKWKSNLSLLKQAKTVMWTMYTA